jgi:TonB-linked SusC/RagA family outer membrane protein
MIALLLFFTFRVSANGYAQKVSIAGKNVALSEIFKTIERQTDFLFFYDKDLIRSISPIDINLKNVTLEEALSACLKGQPLTYSIVKNTIVIQAKKVLTAETSVHPSAPDPLPPPVTIRGRIVNKNGDPLQGVSVFIAGTQKGTITDKDGRFTVTIPEGQHKILQVSSVGYQSQTVKLGRQTDIGITLEESNAELNDVVVVGYGTQKKSDLTGSVAVVQEKDFTQGVTSNALDLINGHAAGVQISQSNAAPGGAVSIKIRGAGSINSSNDPLIVIDGLTGGDPTSLSPNDIASVEVLKDASAAAIYGSRASNGVVIITTKKGKNGPVAVNYNGYLGIQNVGKEIDVLNGRQYMQVLNDLSKDQGQSLPYTQDQIDAIGKGTNWQDAIYKTAIAQNHNLSFSGASDKSNYYIGLNYMNQDGVVLNSNLQKYNARINYEVSPSDKFKVGVHLNSNHTDNRSGALSSSGNGNASVEFDPTLTTTLDSNGQYQQNPLIALDNPLASVNGIHQETVTNRTFGTVTGDYTIFNGFKATVRLGADLMNQRSDNYNSRTTISGLAAGGIASITSSESSHWIAEFLATYDKNIGKAQHLTLLGGVTFEREDDRSVNASSQDFLSDITGTNLLQSGDGVDGDNVSSGRSSNKLNSYLGRVNYTLLNKFLLTASIRADGTSRFSDKDKYAVFPSLALGWRLLEEPFIANTGIFSELKLRASYGQMGNQAIPNYETQQTFTAGGRNTIAVLGNQLVQGVGPARIPNPDLKWETTEEYNIGVDFGILKGRVTGSVEYYIKNTNDQLFDKPLPTTTGYTSILVNFGDVRNQGLDLLLESHNMVGKFKWTTTATLSTLQNKVIRLPAFIPQIIGGGVSYFTQNYTLVKAGLPMRSFYGYQISRIFQQGDDIAHSAQPAAHPGDPEFKDQNGDGKIDASDRAVLGNPFPKYTIGLSNTFAYKRVGLSVLFTSEQGVKVLDNDIVESLYPINFNRNRIAKYYLDRWTPTNTKTPYPSGINPSSYGGALSINSLTITDASFIRLQTATLSYDLALQKKALFKSASVYVAGDNLFTITKFAGNNPDANASGTGVERTVYNSYPLSRTIRIGANLTF